MKVVILAGGRGTRLTEETTIRPKPMVEIGGRPILWHIMKIYSGYGLNDFIICLGYKGYAIKEYFSNYFLHTSNVTFDLARNKVEVHDSAAEPWRVTLVDTGEETQTGGRIKRVQSYLDGDHFCMTYGDGVADVRLDRLLEFHERSGKLATVTAVRPPGRFGALNLDSDVVTGFAEKPQDEGGWINGGFFVLSPRVLDYIDGDHSIWERAPLEKLAKDRQLGAFKHDGFWQPMDTLREKFYLESLCQDAAPPWLKRNWPDAASVAAG